LSVSFGNIIIVHVCHVGLKPEQVSVLQTYNVLQSHHTVLIIPFAAQF
jgi:hypothetical protein